MSLSLWYHFCVKTSVNIIFITTRNYKSKKATQEWSNPGCHEHWVLNVSNCQVWWGMLILISWNNILDYPNKALQGGCGTGHVFSYPLVIRSGSSTLFLQHFSFCFCFFYDAITLKKRNKIIWNATSVSSSIFKVFIRMFTLPTWLEWEQFSFECWKVIGFVSLCYTIGLKKCASLFHPIRSKTKTHRNSFEHIFPCFTSATCNYLLLSVSFVIS